MYEQKNFSSHWVSTSRPLLHNSCIRHRNDWCYHFRYKSLFFSLSGGVLFGSLIINCPVHIKGITVFQEFLKFSNNLAMNTQQNHSYDRLQHGPDKVPHGQTGVHPAAGELWVPVNSINPPSHHHHHNFHHRCSEYQSEKVMFETEFSRSDSPNIIIKPLCVCVIRGLQPAGCGVLLDQREWFSEGSWHIAAGSIQCRELLYNSVRGCVWDRYDTSTPRILHNMWSYMKEHIHF